MGAGVALLFMITVPFSTSVLHLRDIGKDRIAMEIIPRESFDANGIQIQFVEFEVTTAPLKRDYGSEADDNQGTSEVDYSAPIQRKRVCHSCN